MQGKAGVPGGAGDHRAGRRAERFGKTDVGHNAFAEKGVDPLAGAVDKLVRYHQIQGSEVLFQAAHRADRNEPLHPQGFQGVDVGPNRNSGGVEPVPPTVAGQKRDPRILQGTHHYRIAGPAKGRIHLNMLNIGHPLQVIEAAAADYPDAGLASSFLANHTAPCKPGISSGR